MVPSPPPSAQTPVLAGLLLAAGESRRFGGPKAVQRLDDETLVGGSARRLLAVCPAGVVVVTGAWREPVMAALAGLPVTECFHPGWAAGMGSSIAAGVAALSDIRAETRAETQVDTQAHAAADGILILPCDLPAVTAADLAALRAAWAREPGRVAAAVHGGVLGPPVIFPRSLWPRLARLTGEQGARSLLGSVGEPIPVPMAAAALDVDRPADLPGR